MQPQRICISKCASEWGQNAINMWMAGGGQLKKDIPFVFVIKQSKWIQKTVSPPFMSGEEHNLAKQGGGSSLQH